MNKNNSNIMVKTTNDMSLLIFIKSTYDIYALKKDSKLKRYEAVLNPRLYVSVDLGDGNEIVDTRLLMLQIMIV